jgi:hypothetical protein
MSQSHPCPTCFHPIKLTYHQRQSLKRGNQPRCPVCNPRPSRCAVCNGPHRTREHAFDGKAVCAVCCDLPWRRVLRCKGCREMYEPEPTVVLEDPMRSHMGRVADFGGGT